MSKVLLTIQIIIHIQSICLGSGYPDDFEFFTACDSVTNKAVQQLFGYTEKNGAVIVEHGQYGEIMYHIASPIEFTNDVSVYRVHQVYQTDDGWCTNSPSSRPHSTRFVSCSNNKGMSYFDPSFIITPDYVPNKVLCVIYHDILDMKFRTKFDNVMDAEFIGLYLDNKDDVLKAFIKDIQREESRIVSIESWRKKRFIFSQYGYEILLRGKSGYWKVKFMFKAEKITYHIVSGPH